MFFPVSSQLGAPVTLPKSETIAQPLANMRANIMPTLQQTIYGLAPVEMTGSSHKYEENGSQNSISHPRYAPSSVSSEEFLVARVGMAPVYNHNMAATREARTSNFHEDMPRFRDQIDLLA
jgi:hypothetical protein